MRRPMAKKVLAATMAAAMTMSVAACGNTPASTSASVSADPVVSTSESVSSTSTEEVSKYTVLKDADGNVYDLGGFELYIRDWWSSDERQEAKSDYEEALYDYRDWAEETYNFKVHTVTMGDWGSCGQDFVDYVTAGGDDTNYVWTVFSGNATLLSAAQTGLCYDLSTLDCLDFSDAKYANNTHKLYSLGGGIYGMHAGPAEPRTGIFFNKRILTEAGVNPDDIYDMQANDTWTWEAYENILEKTQQDTDNDGTIDIWGIAVNEGVGISAAVYSNGGAYVAQDADGNYTYEIENPKTVEAFEWIYELYKKYDWDGPTGEDGSAPSWDYYQGQFKAGQAVSYIDQQYCATPGQLLYDMEDELMFVCFPKGPQGKLIQAAMDNVYVIPGCYDADRAWKCAFAFDVFNELVPGYEDYNPYINTTRTGNFDTRAAEETVPIMSSSTTVELQNVIPNNDQFMNGPLLWKMGPNGTETIAEILDGVRDIAKQYIDEANNQ